MSAKLTGEVWELDLPRDEQTVLHAMADNAHDDGTNCYPGVDYLVWKTGYDRRSVQRILRKLITSGLVVVVHGRGGRGRGLDYNIVISAGKKKRPWAEVREELRRQKRAAKRHPLSDERAAACHPFEEGSGEERAASGRPLPHERVSPRRPLSPEKGRHPEPERAASGPRKGDTGVAPPSLLNHTEPTSEPTHTARPRATPTPPEAGSAGVRVVRSSRPYEERKAYAADVGLGGGWLHNSQDGRYDDDEQYVEWRARREKVRAGEPALRPKRMGLNAATQLINSVWQRGEDVTGEIERLDADDEVKRQLRERFPARQQAAARAP